MKFRFLLLTTVLLVAVSLAAAVKPNEPGRLAGYIAVGASPDFLKDWLLPGSPHVPLVKQFHIGETAYVGFIATGVLPNKSGQASVTVDVRIARPDGSVLFEQTNYATVVGQKCKVAGFVIADPALDLEFDSTDPVGTYSVVAMFHDAVSNKGALCEVRIELIKKA